MDEATLVRRCLTGDQRATVDLIERFQGEVVGLCIRLLGHRQDAEDVAQEVFLRVFRSLRRWDQTRPLRPWIMGITVNRCRTWMARRSRQPEPVDFLGETPSREHMDDSAELLVEIRGALGHIRPDYRLVFVLFHEQGRSYDEIAQLVGRPIGTVKTWLHRARAELLDHLQRRGFLTEEPPALSPGKSAK